MAAVIATSTGSGTPTTLLVTSGSGFALPVNTSVNLFQNTTTTITGAGHTVRFLGQTVADFPRYVQVDISIDGTSIYNSHAGQQISTRQVLAVGSHTITFTAFALNQACNLLSVHLMVTDLGL